MILNNYKHYIASTILGVSGSDYITSMVDYTGKNVTVQSGYSLYDGLGYNLNIIMRSHAKRSLQWSNKLYDGYSTGGVKIGATTGVIFGSGTKPVTEQDYKMEGVIATEYSSTETITTTLDSVTHTYSITNTGTSDMVIGEIGLFKTIEQRNVSASNKHYYSDVLMERTVLDTPVTIPAGGMAQITYTIQMNYPVT